MKHLGKKTAALLALLVVVGGLVAALEFTNTTHLLHDPKSKASDSDINYGPPTEVEKQDSESHKDSLPEKGDDTAKNNGTVEKKNATVEITTWAQKTNSLDVNGFVANIIEEGGTCKLTLTYGTDPSQIVTQTRTATANATNTTCGVIAVPLSKLQPGTWSAVLSYSSAVAGGSSSSTQLEVE